METWRNDFSLFFPTLKGLENLELTRNCLKGPEFNLSVAFLLALPLSGLMVPFVPLIFSRYLYTVKNSSGTINSNTMTNILKPKNPNPNIILTYNNMPLKKPDFHECRV